MGALPCPDCADTRAHLDLWPDGTYHLGRALTDKPGRDDDLGRWRRDPGRPVLLLYGGREMPMQLEVVGPRTLRALDLDGKPAGEGAKYDLSSDGRLQPTDLSRGLHGMFRYLADAAIFEECMTGRSYPVAMEGDYLALERAYTALDKAEPGAPVMASFDGELTRRPPMEGKGTVPTVVVRRFVGLWPSQTCERAMSHASLSNQYWKILSLKGEAVAPVEGSGEMHLVLRGEGGGYTASAGCERLNGGYRVDGPRITFDPPADLRPGGQPARERGQLSRGPAGTATHPARRAGGREPLVDPGTGTRAVQRLRPTAGRARSRLPALTLRNHHEPVHSTRGRESRPGRPAVGVQHDVYGR